MYILLVDNNLFYAAVLKELMRKAGFNQIKHLDSGLECMLQLQKNEVPDVIIIDESQCYVNGVDVIKDILSHNPNLTLIVLTGTESPVNVNFTPEKGSTICIAKDSVTADNLPQILYNIFTEKINFTKKSSSTMAFSSFKKSFANMLNF
jgi:two-component SAPR family response regulator